MEKDQALEIMEILYASYPNFNKNNMKKFNQIWVGKLMELGDYPKTLKKTNDYIADSPYPPSLADIIVKIHKPYDDGMAEKIKAAEAKVAAEKADPEKAKKRAQSLERMKRKLGEFYGD